MARQAERRRSQRFEIRIPVSLEVVREHQSDGGSWEDTEADSSARNAGGIRFAGVIRNLSARGAFIAMEHAPPLRATVALSFRNEGSAPMSATGLVVWRRTSRGAGRIGGSPGLLEPGLGIAFNALAPDVVAFIDKVSRLD
jgi:hypothetical protein